MEIGFEPGGLCSWLSQRPASLTGRSVRISTLSDENRGTSGVRSPDEHSNESRTTPCRSGSSCAVRVSSGSTGCPTIGSPRLRLWPRSAEQVAVDGSSCSSRRPRGICAACRGRACTPRAAAAQWVLNRVAYGSVDSLLQAVAGFPQSVKWLLDVPFCAGSLLVQQISGRSGRTFCANSLLVSSIRMLKRCAARAVLLRHAPLSPTTQGI